MEEARKAPVEKLRVRVQQRHPILNCELAFTSALCAASEARGKQDVLYFADLGAFLKFLVLISRMHYVCGDADRLVLFEEYRNALHLLGMANYAQCLATPG